MEIGSVFMKESPILILKLASHTHLLAMSLNMTAQVI
jgi:hypothetical protein